MFESLDPRRITLPSALSSTHKNITRFIDSIVFDTSRVAYGFIVFVGHVTPFVLLQESHYVLEITLESIDLITINAT